MNFHCVFTVCLALIASTAPALAAKPQDNVNPEFGLRVTFPAGGKVCTALSGDHPHGFYAWYHGQPTDCGAAHTDPAATAVSIYASYNSSFLKSPLEELDASCKTAVPLVSQRNLSFRGYSSISCVTKKANGVIEVDVVAYTGKWKDADISPDPDLQTPYLSYRASLTTTSDRFEKDMVLFRAFLASIDIRPPQ